MSAPIKYIRQKRILMHLYDNQCGWCRRPVYNSKRLIKGEPDYGVENLPFQASLDHWILRSKGGGNCLENMILSCSECNQERGNRDFDDYHAEMQRRGLNPLSKNVMRRKGKFAGIIHRYMGAREMPLRAIETAIEEIRLRDERRRCHMD